MPSFRKVKHSNYTVIDNCVFKDFRLSAKAKGLLSQMLSLPDDWNYSIAGLTTLFSDGESSIRSGLDELKNFGYLRINRITDSKGKVVDWEYVIFEDPNLENTDVENPHVENPDVENKAQLNTNESNMNKSNTHQYKNESDEKNQTPKIGPTESEASVSKMCSRLSEKKTRKSMIPSEDEVVEYCSSNNMSIDPHYFYKYYSKLGWKDSNGNPVKNWKRKAMTWNAKNSAKAYSDSVRSSCTRNDSALDKILAKALDEYPWCGSLEDFHVTEQYGQTYLMPKVDENGRKLDRWGFLIDGRDV